MRIVVPLLALGLVSCSGGIETSFKRLTPEISSAPGDVEFGSVVTLYPVTQTVQLLNTGSGALNIFGYELKVNERHADIFTIDGLDEADTISSGDAFEFDITFLPTQFTSYNARLDIESNSAFDHNGESSEWDAEDHHFLQIEITGEGIKGSTPDIDVPSVVDFGDVTPGDTSTETVLIRNAGEGVLTVLNANIPDGPFSLRFPIESVTIAPGESYPAPVEFAPTLDDADGAVEMVILSTDPDEGEVSVRLAGNGNYGRPIADIDCDAIASNPPPRTIILDGRGSTAPEDPEGLFQLTFDWELISRPELSRTSLRNPGEETPELFLDVAGVYEIGLTVTDHNGVSSEQAICEADIIPDEELYVALSWDTTNSDLDLHMVPEGELMWGCMDCFWCEPSPDWPADWGTPVYALDNTTGYGPENINVSFPGERKYYIRTHYYSDRGGSETRATVSIYIQGELVETLTATLPTSGHRWKIGYVDFAATGIGTFHLEDVVETYYGRACPDC